MKNLTPEKRLIAALVLAAKTDDMEKRQKCIKRARKVAAFLTDDTIRLCKIFVELTLRDATNA